MKLGARDIAAFIANPGAVQAALVYGPDRGQVREKAEAIALKIVPDAHDPFNRVELSSDTLLDDPARLMDELGAMSLVGGRRLIIIRDVSDKLGDILETAFEALDVGNYLLLTADELPAKSPIRVLFESDKRSVSLACYKDEGVGLTQLIRDGLAKSHIGANQEIIAYLSSNLGGDRQIILNEIEKLALYAMHDTTLELEDVRQLIEGSNEKTLDDVCLAVASGQIETLCRTLDRLFSEGTQEIVVLRSLHRYFSRLQEVHQAKSRGMALDQALKVLRPPLFFKQEPAFKRHLEQWRPQKIEQVLHLLMEAEKDCKLGGDLSATLCCQQLLRIARAA